MKINVPQAGIHKLTLSPINIVINDLSIFMNLNNEYWLFGTKRDSLNIILVFNKFCDRLVSKEVF